MFSKLVALLVFAAVPLAACSSGDDDSSSTDDPSTTEVSSDDPAPDSNESAAGGYSAEEAGTGTLTVDGTRIDGFTGECEISRDNGREDVGELSLDGIEIVLAIDNVDSSPAEEMNYIVVGSTYTFRSAGNGDGNLSGIGYAGVRNSLSETRDIGLVNFTGTTAEGLEVSAEVVCITQNMFS